MDPQSRSEQVVEAYKRHKLARSALWRIRERIREFDAARATDRRLAWIGIALLVIVGGLVCLYFVSAERVTLI